jgi:hypothetical protein
VATNSKFEFAKSLISWLYKYSDITKCFTNTYTTFNNGITRGRAIAQAVSHWLHTVVAQVSVRAEHVEFVVDKVALGRFSPSTLVSLANHHFTKFSIIIITGGWHNRPIGGCGAEWTQLDSTLHYLNFLINL